ncbi:MULTISPECIES: hypothetical protein [Amycolatopsis]|uniref:Uncharacterized protein n=1 Tax=Amycolatopsis dendrobii TaxID=2760662 RepID=A0A7W3ZEY3_9PSEU|nr:MULTISPECIES: hypothetical protein [Amycolatopsis]MBB1158444.1 hypothetical protein [Amycolatopsis dendrobii]UKD56949.1 hypothetical protein L3Q65_09570 [Amycolatopsis sp. FU40]
MVAIAVGVLALTAGAAAASASPAGGSALDAVHSRFDPVARPAAPLDGDVTAFHGFSTLQNLVVQSHGFDLEGEIHGRLRTFNFKSLWQVYNLPSSDSWKIWVVSFKHDSSRSVLKEVFHSEQLIDVNIDVKFRVSAANLRGVSSLRIGFETLRLQLDGQTKDFTVVNGASGGAKDQNNNDVPVDFQQV